MKTKKLAKTMVFGFKKACTEENTSVLKELHLLLMKNELLLKFGTR